MSVTIETGQRLALDQRLLDVSKPIRMAAGGGAKSGEDSGTIVGTACRYGVELDRGWVFLELVAGCFAAALKDPARVLVLWQHDSHEPIGQLRTLTDSDEKLAYTGRITDSEDVPNGRKALHLLDEGILSEVSVSFQVQKYERIVDEEKDTVTYRVLKAWLMELSIVSWGAFGQDATVEQVFAELAPPALPSEPAAAQAGAHQAARLRARMAGWS